MLNQINSQKEYKVHFCNKKHDWQVAKSLYQCQLLGLSLYININHVSENKTHTSSFIKIRCNIRNVGYKYNK